MNVKSIALCIAVAIVDGARPAAAEEEVRQCLGAEESIWAEIWRNSLGVDGVDPERPSIQAAQSGQVRWPAATDGLHQWIPFGPRKAKLCGAVREHRPYCPKSFFDVFSECDRNVFILPAGGYEYLRDEPIHNKLVTDRTKMVCCSTGRECTGPGKRCIETEITPSAEITDNPAMARVFLSLLGPETTRDDDPEGTKPWLWKEMCTYGPWAGDSGHGTRPEIHPVQLRWTREAEERALVLMWMQDASARFIERRNFVHRRRPGDDWSPWAVTPVHGLFRIAFQADVDAPPTIRITREMGNHIQVADPDGCTETGEGCVVEGRVGDEVVLRAIKLMPAGDIEMSVDPVCRRTDGRYIGYIHIEAAVGHEACGEEGYLILRVEEMPRPGGTAMPALAYSAPPLFSEATASEAQEIAAPSGRKLGGGVTRVEPGDLEQADGAEAVAAWQALLEGISSDQIATALGNLASPPVSIVRARKWGLSVEPHYEGGADAVPVGVDQDINEAIAEREGKKIAKIVSAAARFHVDAPGEMIDVVDLTTRERAVPVFSEVTHARGPASAESAFRIEPWNLTRWSPGVRIRIPREPPGALYRVRFRAELEDAEENEVPVEHTFLSHGVDGSDYLALIEILLHESEGLTHLDVQALAAMAQQPGDRWDDNRTASSRASQLLVIAESYGEDGIITSEEFEGVFHIFEAFRDAYASGRSGE